MNISIIRDRKRRSDRHQYRRLLLAIGYFFVACVFIILLFKIHNRKFTNKLLPSNHVKFRILHIVTILSLGTPVRWDLDRLVQWVIPCLSVFLQSIQLHEPSWEVDVFLIIGDSKLESDRREIIEKSLPPGVGLQVWEDAIPLRYDSKASNMTLSKSALARQHRFVIRDKLNDYDFFSAWEEDMAITVEHIRHFIEMTRQIETVRKSLQQQQHQVGYNFTPDNTKTFYGPMHADQLERVFPGFIRVEVLAADKQSQPELDPISIAPDVAPINASICCTTSNNSLADGADNVIVWETTIEAMGVRQFPSPIGWAGILPGVQSAKNHKNSVIGSFWSGEQGAFGKDVKRQTHVGRGDLMAQQAGFMATRAQIELFQKKCPGGFLPPFDSEFWKGNAGLKPQSVEFWSGGYQLFSSCLLQRIVSLDPERFSKHLLLHSANKKQRTIERKRLVKVNNLLGQLHTVLSYAKKRSQAGS